MEEVARHLKAGKAAEDEEMELADKKKKKKDKKAEKKRKADDDESDEEDFDKVRCSMYGIIYHSFFFGIKTFPTTCSLRRPRKNQRRKRRKRPSRLRKKLQTT